MLCRSSISKALGFFLGALTALVFLGPSFADDLITPQLRFDHGAFQPTRLMVRANKPFKMKVTNGSDSAIEFESFELHRERMVAPGETIVVHMPSLAPGSYQFFDDFHHEVPKGIILSQ